MYGNIFLIEVFVVISLMIIHQTTSIPTHVSEFCPNTTMFVNNSAYQTNLNTLFHSLSTNATNNPSGFYQAVIDNSTTEAIYGQYMCRGDQNNISCYDCITTATTIDLPTTYCPNRKTAIIWYDECMVRYSNEQFFKKMDQSLFTLYNTMNISGNATRFIELLDNMMNNVIADQAADGGPLRKFAVGSVNFTSFQSIYGLGQCTPDLTRDDCYMCLTMSIQELPVKLGSRVITPSCIVRYETYPFFNRSYLPQSESNSSSSDETGNYPPLVLRNTPRSGVTSGVIIGICVAAVIVILLSVGVYLRCIRQKKMNKASLLPKKSKGAGSIDQAGGASNIPGIDIGKSAVYSYEELAEATNNFNMSFKIGEGGFGTVYFAELRGEKAAIKKMDMQATKEFLAELKVLTHVHHLNLVRLLGYCVEGSLFLVYEFIDNGNLSQHLRSSGRDPLQWSTRVQIALDSARGLEYIHEHTVPMYIHRDIKPANILINNNFQAKVADFGLTKLSDVGNASLPTRLVGTFGYMPPEYAQFGEVTPKVDVFAFGVVLYELISAKDAVLKPSNSAVEFTSIADLFEDVLSRPDPNEISKLIDPRLGDDYPFESVRQLAELARACTQDSPQLRPSMRAVVVALTTLSSATGNWDIDSFYRKDAVSSRVSGR